MEPWQLFIIGLCEHLAWPVLISICVCCFRTDIRNILSRIKKLPGGTELDPETVKEQKENKNTYDELVAKKAEDKIKQEVQEQKQ